MSLTLSTATTQVRDILNEDTSVFWSDTEIQQWIQEGVMDFSSKSLMIEAEGTITLAASKLSYSSSDAAFLSSIIEPYAALYTDSTGLYKGLIKVHQRMIGNEATNTTGAPKYYALHNHKIYIWPKTSATVVAASGSILLLYAKATNDITLVPDEYQHIPLFYAAARCKYKDQKFAEGNAFMSIYSAGTNFERSDKHAREEDTLDMFKVKPKGGQRGSA